jgi:hypothetical protein
MASHLRPSYRRHARPLGALAVAFGVALLVIAAMSGRSPDDDTTELVQPATDVSTEPTVLGSTIERSTTLPSAPPASALGFTTTSTTSDDSPSGGGGGGGGPAPTTQATTSPTLGPPVAITNTTTTRPAPPPPACSDGEDNADPEDDLIDDADPGCYVDPSDPETYDPNDGDETDPPSP